MAVRGQREFEKYRRGEPLTHKQTLLAQCFICNGAEEGGEDCKSVSCPLYQYMPYKTGRKKRLVSEEERQVLAERLNKARRPVKLPSNGTEILQANGVTFDEMG